MSHRGRCGGHAAGVWTPKRSPLTLLCPAGLERRLGKRGLWWSSGLGQECLCSLTFHHKAMYLGRMPSVGQPRSQVSQGCDQGIRGSPTVHLVAKRLDLGTGATQSLFRPSSPSELQVATVISEVGGTGEGFHARGLQASAGWACMQASWHCCFLLALTGICGKVGGPAGHSAAPGLSMVLSG